MTIIILKFYTCIIMYYIVHAFLFESGAFTGLTKTHIVPLAQDRHSSQTKFSADLSPLCPSSVPSYQGGIIEYSLGNSVELVSRYFFHYPLKIDFCFLEQCLDVSHLADQPPLDSTSWQCRLCISGGWKAPRFLRQRKCTEQAIVGWQSFSSSGTNTLNSTNENRLYWVIFRETIL